MFSSSLNFSSLALLSATSSDSDFCGIAFGCCAMVRLTLDCFGINYFDTKKRDSILGESR